MVTKEGNKLIITIDCEDREPSEVLAEYQSSLLDLIGTVSQVEASPSVYPVTQLIKHMLAEDDCIR